MKNPLLTIIALLVLAGVLFAQSFPPGGGAHPIIRKIELAGPIQVEGIVPLRDHISIPWTCSLDAAGVSTPFEWTCPAGMHARVTMISDGYGGADDGRPETSWVGSVQLAGGDTGHVFAGRRVGGNSWVPYTPNRTIPRELVLHPEDTLRLENIENSWAWPCSSTGILQLAVEYD